MKKSRFTIAASKKRLLGPFSMPFLRVMVVGLAGLSLYSCSSITSGSTQDIAINTYPTGATCTLQREGIDIGKVDKTPASINVDRTKHDITIICSKDGYHTATFLNESGWQSDSGGAGIALDVLLTFGMSSAIDSATGADNEYASPIHITLLSRSTAELITDSKSNESTASRIDQTQDQSDMLERFERLNNLEEEGLITSEEAEAKRQNLLKEM